MKNSSTLKCIATALLSSTALLGFSMSTQAQTPSAKVVEYYHTGLKHYFITANPEHQRLVETGVVGKEWQKTGVSWGAYKSQSDAVGLSPVCRFFVPGAVSHFYTAVPSECELVKTYQGLVFEGIDHYIESPSAGTCTRDKLAIYRTYNNGFMRNDSNHRFVPDASWHAKAASKGFSPEGVAMCAPMTDIDRELDAIRLLKQATFGPNTAAIDEAKRLGAEAWIEAQFSKASSVLPAMDYVPSVRPDTCVDSSTPPITKDSYCNRDNYSAFQVQRRFYEQAVSGEDQLRQRTAWALSQILVTSAREVPFAYANRNYQQLLRDIAFSNFESALLAITLSPMMGDYLDMVNNRKTYNGIQPNENYAREIMQLFAMGTVMLNDDGTAKRDASGAAIPSYGQPEIMALTRALTGWTYAPRPGVTSRWTNPRNYEGELVAFADYHDTGEKILAGGTKIPAGQSANDDLRAAVKAVFNHPNVGPFMSKALIQKMVTGDPSPAYVARVTNIFNNNGLGQRGDMRSVIRAILLDVEARGPYKVEPTFGKLKEPVLHLTGLLRGLDGKTDGVELRNISDSLQQQPYASPTVFNYYSPDFPVTGTNLIGPEFGLLDANLAVTRINQTERIINTSTFGASGVVFGSTGTRLEWAPLTAIAGDANALVERIAKVFGVLLPDAAKATIVKAVAATPATDPTARAKNAAFLIYTSAYGQIDR